MFSFAEPPLPRLDRLNKTLDLFKSVSSTMSPSQVQAFLLVANHPDKSMGELAKLADVPMATMSRYLLDWSDKRRDGKKGYGLIARSAAPEELRRNKYKLSDAGYALAARVEEAIGG
jgi:DNA-binding MarR family transcriptional regulator